MKNFISSVTDILSGEDVKFKDPDTEKKLINLLNHLDADLVSQGYTPSDNVVELIEDFEKHLEELYEYEPDDDDEKEDEVDVDVEFEDEDKDDEE